MKTVNDVRASFLSFFKRHGHNVLASAPLVPLNDPTLMFTAAGMVPFKNIFTGIEPPPSPPRAATSQKCVRAGGKHNDLDNVGYTARHHTFFEMLGNFSFGDYFKETAIEHAWELLTKDFALPPEKLCVTVYHDDDVAWNHWKKITGFADHKIIRINSLDNFWSAGDTGPCGPCSEIFFDHGDKIPGGPPGSPEADGDRFVEIWNLVFMQYEQVDANTRLNLPKPSIDTGMGLERISAVLQGVHSNYEIDLFQHLIADIEEISGVRSQVSENSLTPDTRHLAPYKVIADHLRASCFLIADGVMPSNEGRGYVLRRIMRRAMRYAHQLGCKDPLMYKLVPSLTGLMGDAYPELKRAQATITENLKGEEERFKQTLDRGLKLLEEESASLNKGGTLSGDVAFKLYDTFGFPLDLTQDILRVRGIGVDVAGFERGMDGQREMARASHKGSGDTATSRIWFDVKEKTGATQFLGYDSDTGDAKVAALVKDGAEVPQVQAGDEAYIILDRTPFYGESGGQVGDTGVLSHGGHIAADVLDTMKPVEDLHVHKAKLRKALKVGDAVQAAIDSDRRNAIRANHSATHLLHKALRDALGEHVTQKGSLVAPDRLRFDFSHGKGVAPEEIAAIEKAVNEVVWKNAPVGCKLMKPDDAIKAGAMALFGEKYGSEVRVLSMDASVELCGGTHVKNTGDIGVFKVVSEGSVAAGIRRIEAVTRDAVRQHFIEELGKQHERVQKLQGEKQKLLAELSKPAPAEKLPETAGALQNAPVRELHGIFQKASDAYKAQTAALVEENKKLGKELAEAKKQAALGGGEAAQKQDVGGVGFVSRVFDDLPPKDLRSVVEDMLKTSAADVAVAATGFEGKASVVVAVNKALAEKHSAVQLVQAAVEAVGGKGGGGRPEMAQGGGPDASKLEDAVNAVKARLAA